MFYQKKRIINFFFPMYPLKLKKSIPLIVTLSTLIALRIVLQYTTISLPQFGMVISISHTPLIIIGWIFGPIIGMFAGAVTDTISYFIKPSGAWFWLYSIQEPLLGFLSGIISSIYVIRKGHDSNLFDIIFSRIITYSFTIVSLIIILVYAREGNKWQGISQLDQDKFFDIYKYIAIASLIIFSISFEIFNIWAFKKNKGREKLLIYASLICFLNAIIFSFLLGTVSAIEYYKFLHGGKNSSYLIKYGFMFYLIPRIIKETIKTPVQILILISLLYILIPIFKNIFNYSTLTWNNDIRDHKIKAKTHWI